MTLLNRKGVSAIAARITSSSWHRACASRSTRHLHRLRWDGAHGDGGSGGGFAAFCRSFFDVALPISHGVRIRRTL